MKVISHERFNEVYAQDPAAVPEEWSVLEGGYNYSVLGENVRSFPRGFSD